MLREERKSSLQDNTRLGAEQEGSSQDADKALSVCVSLSLSLSYLIYRCSLCLRCMIPSVPKVVFWQVTAPLLSLKLTSFIILHVNLSPKAFFGLPISTRLTVYCWSIKCVGVDIQVPRMAINNPHHLLMAWDASRASHVSWELFLDNPTFFFCLFHQVLYKEWRD